MDLASGKGSWSHVQQQQTPVDDDDDWSTAAAQSIVASKENLNPTKTASDAMKMTAQTVASQLLCELALELD
jgi:hypothetical protein